MDPISLLVGGVLLAVGFAAGRIGRRRPPPPPPMTPLCGCGHALSQHDRETSTCRLIGSMPALLPARTPPDGNAAGNTRGVVRRCRTDGPDPTGLLRAR